MQTLKSKYKAGDYAIYLGRVLTNPQTEVMLKLETPRDRVRSGDPDQLLGKEAQARPLKDVHKCPAVLGRTSGIEQLRDGKIIRTLIPSSMPTTLTSIRRA